jgi:hypothetical protein
MIHFVAPDFVDFPSGLDIVDDMAVGTGDDGGIVGGFGAAFDLDTVDAGVHQLF